MVNNLGHLKERCAGCQRGDVEFTKEHIFPEWLILKTKTNKTGIRWMFGKRIPALSCTLPLCLECNKIFGRELELPVSMIFDNLEAGLGISDNEAELLVRWMWKITGLAWIAEFPEGIYTEQYTLRDRVINPLDEIRPSIVLGLSLIQEIDPYYGDAPIGIDSTNIIDAIFASGVFSKIAIMVVLDSFSNLVPEQFSLYRLQERRDLSTNTKVFYPKIGFKDDSTAVLVTKASSVFLSRAHDNLVLSVLEQEEK